MTTPETSIVARQERWQKCRTSIVESLSPRLQKDITRFPPAESNKAIASTYIHGPTGSGKTVRAVQLMIQHLRHAFINRRSCQYVFTTVPELLLSFKDNYSSKERVAEGALVDVYSKVPLLVLDDFGTEYTTDWSFQMLYIIINRRYEEEHTTIFTSNFSLSELSDKLGDDRIPGRIQQMCQIVKVKNVDYRTKKKL